MSTPTAEVERVVFAFAEAWNRHDMKAFAELFAPDAEFVNVVGMWWKGREEIKAAHKFTHATMFKSSRLTILETSVRFPEPQLAIPGRGGCSRTTSARMASLFPRDTACWSTCSHFETGDCQSLTRRTPTSSKVLFPAAVGAGSSVFPAPRPQ